MVMIHTHTHTVESQKPIKDNFNWVNSMTRKLYLNKSALKNQFSGLMVMNWKLHLLMNESAFEKASKLMTLGRT